MLWTMWGQDELSYASEIRDWAIGIDGDPGRALIRHSIVYRVSFNKLPHAHDACGAACSS